jgi:hypothetical protein
MHYQIASCLHGTVQPPDDATLKTLFIRAMPTDLRNSLALQGMDASSSLDDIKKPGYRRRNLSTEA